MMTKKFFEGPTFSGLYVNYRTLLVEMPRGFTETLFTITTRDSFGVCASGLFWGFAFLTASMLYPV